MFSADLGGVRMANDAVKLDSRRWSLFGKTHGQLTASRMQVPLAAIAG